MQRHTENPRFSGFQGAAVTDYVEENAYERESHQTADESRQRQQEQVHEMAPVRADERPRARDQPEHVARTQSASVGKRDYVGSRRRCDCRFRVQSNRIDSLGGSGARGCQYLVFERELGFASYRVLIAAKRVTALQIR